MRLCACGHGFSARTPPVSIQQAFLWYSIDAWLKKVYFHEPDLAADKLRNYMAWSVRQRVESYGILHEAVFRALTQIGDPEIRYMLEQAREAVNHHNKMAERIYIYTSRKNENSLYRKMERAKSGLPHIEREIDPDPALCEQYCSVFMVRDTATYRYLKSLEQKEREVMEILKSKRESGKRSE